MRHRSFLRASAVAATAWMAVAAAPARPAAEQRAGAVSAQPGIYLVFPFVNAGASPRLDWLGEGLEELTIQRLSAAGQQVYSHAGRMAELDRYGLPPHAKFSRATMLRVAEELDADYVVFGSFTSDGKSLTVVSRILQVTPTALRPALTETGPLNSLMDLHTRLTWRLLSSVKPAYPLGLNDFARRQRPLRLDSFEHYIRGLLAADDEPRIRELRESARLEPEWPAPQFALGQVYFTRHDCNSALLFFARVPRTDDRYAEAIFMTGVCRLQMEQADRAEESFAGLQETMRTGAVSGGDVPEILNNLAIARDRQGKSPQALKDLRAAVDMDPDEDDYPFNLGLLQMRAGDFAGAAVSFREASERQPENAEDRALLVLSLQKAGKKDEAEQERISAAEVLGPGALPAIRADALNKLERLKVDLDTTALRVQAGAESASAANRAAGAAPSARVRSGHRELAAGRIDAAEAEFRGVLAADPSNATAHRGLAEVARRRNDLDGAVRELQASIAARDSAGARTSLAKVYLDQKKNQLARAELERALKLAPNYAEAKQLLERLTANHSPGGAR